MYRKEKGKNAMTYYGFVREANRGQFVKCNGYVST